MSATASIQEASTALAAVARSYRGAFMASASVSPAFGLPLVAPPAPRSAAAASSSGAGAAPCGSGSGGPGSADLAEVSSGLGCRGVSSHSKPFASLQQAFSPPGGKHWRPGRMSEGPSESSVVMDTTEDEIKAMPSLEQFYEKVAAEERLSRHPHGQPSSPSWVLSLARGYRRFSKDRRSRCRLQSLLLQQQQHLGLGWTSNTDDSGYEAGYETDADESEMSEWENIPACRGHKRKVDALAQLTMKLSVAEGGEEVDEDMPHAESMDAPPSRPSNNLFGAPLRYLQAPRLLSPELIEVYKLQPK